MLKCQEESKGSSWFFLGQVELSKAIGDLESLDISQVKSVRT